MYDLDYLPSQSNKCADQFVLDAYIFEGNITEYIKIHVNRGFDNPKNRAAEKKKKKKKRTIRRRDMQSSKN